MISEPGINIWTPFSHFAKHWNLELNSAVHVNLQPLC